MTDSLKILIMFGLGSVSLRVGPMGLMKTARKKEALTLFFTKSVIYMYKTLTSVPLCESDEGEGVEGRGGGGLAALKLQVCHKNLFVLHFNLIQHVDEAIKIANRNTASETVRTLLVYGYVLDPPSSDQQVFKRQTFLLVFIFNQRFSLKSECRI